MILLALALAVSSAQDPREAQVYALYHEQKLLTARRLTEELLEDEPNSVMGHYIFGCVLRESEGQLAKAMHHLGRARELYEAANGVPGTNWKLHRELINAIQQLAGELEEHRYQLQMLDFYDALYEPDLPGNRAWPLMKLGRFDEARQFARLARSASDHWQRSLGFNALCAIESEAANREDAYEACLAALAEERTSSAPDVTVDAYNASRAAIGVLRFDEAEQLAHEGIAGMGLTTANPWMILTELALIRGKGKDAVTAMRDLQRWKKRLPPHLREQNRAELDANLALLLLVAGEAPKAKEIINRAIQFPDRRGFTSAHAEQALGAHALIRLAVLDLETETLHEQVSAQGIGPRSGQWLGGWTPRTRTWEDRATLTSLLAHPSRLQRTFRPYMSGGLSQVPTWLVGDLIPIVGPGVANAALRDLSQQDPPEFEGYYRAYNAEVAWWSGQYARTFEEGERALKHLPAQEVLLRARTHARVADAQRRRGEWTSALAHYTSAMRNDPSVIRRLGLALPAIAKQAASGEAARLASTIVGRSPRIDWTPSAFTVSVEGDEDDLATCLRTPDGTLLSCALAPRPAPGESDSAPWTDAEYARHVVDTFHRETFAMPLGLTSHDLGSLDGRPTVATGLERERLQGLLDDVKDEGKSQ